MGLFQAIKSVIRKRVSHDFVNLFWHLPIAYLAVFLYGNSGQKLKLIGVTGTDGKTTTTNIIYHVLKTAGYRVSMISSVKAVIGATSYDTGFHVTSPHPFAVQRFLKEAAQAGSEYMVLEVTSHGLSQHRFAGCTFDLGVLTNVTHEHLDYHQNYQNYLAAKQKLLKMARVAILNKDDYSYRLLDADVHSKEYTYGLTSADVTVRKFPFTTKLHGEFNAYNNLAAIAVAQKLGISDTDIRKGIASFIGVPGRFEIVYDEDFMVIVDFAHTPHSFEQLLKAIRSEYGKRKITHIFGSAALRDVTKRPLMGKISAEYADTIILTEEDYRTENLIDIFDQIESGIKGVKPVTRIDNRGDAIMHAIGNARKGDIILATGKAHEKSLARGTVEYEWDEFAAIRNALKKRNAKKR